MPRPHCPPTINNGQLQISHPVIGGNQIEAECSFTLEAGSWEAIPVTISEAGIATASVDLSAANGKCFIRWSGKRALSASVNSPLP